MFRSLTAVAALMGAATVAQAEVVAGDTFYSVNDRDYEGYTAYDDARPSRGTVLIIHDWDGLTEYEKQRAEMLADMGYTAFAVDLYGAGVEPQGIDDYRALSGALKADPEAIQQRIADAMQAAEDIPGASDKLVLMGYCFGGGATLEAARAGMEFDGFVSFHGDLSLPEGANYAAAKGPILIQHGSADPVSGMEDLALTLNTVEADGAHADATVYGGARHSFTVFDSADYDEVADKASWLGLETFLAALPE